MKNNICSSKKLTCFLISQTPEKSFQHAQRYSRTPNNHPRRPISPFKKFSIKFEISWKSLLLGVTKKSLRHCGFLSRDRIEATNAFLDRSSHTLVGKIAPVSNEFTDSEISSFLWPIFQLLSLTKLSQTWGARETVNQVYRAGWLVEPFSSPSFFSRTSDFIFFCQISAAKLPAR